ncbi:hypothetical protein SEA_JFLIX2_32 [Rhodococcus phage Jflix2]|nr:hypothetical protein SEA_JFLIX2_32 [Rhodococcus phage Jflix2]
MKIYLLKAHDQNRPYDHHVGFVVVAQSRGEARRTVCHKHFSKEPWETELGQHEIDERAFWMDPERAECTPIGEYEDRNMSPHVVLSDYRAG